MNTKLRLICECEIWSGFFGINERGDHPICNYEIIEDVEEECLEIDEMGIRPSYSIECPSCGCEHGWGDNWEIIN